MPQKSSNVDPFFEDAFGHARPTTQAIGDVVAAPGRSVGEAEEAIDDEAVQPPVDAVELPTELDDDGWFDAVSTGATGRSSQATPAAPVDAPTGAASLPLDGELVRPPRKSGRSKGSKPKGRRQALNHDATSPEKAPRVKPALAPIPPKEPKVRAARPKRERPPKPTRAERTEKAPKRVRPPKPARPVPAAADRSRPDRHRARRGPRIAVLGGAVLAVLVAAVVLATGSGGEDPAASPRTLPQTPTNVASAQDQRHARDVAAMRTAGERGDYDVAISLAEKVDPDAAVRYKAAAAAVMVRRASQAAERGDLPLSRSRLQRARERYGPTADAKRVARRVRSIEKARADRARLRQRRAAARRRTARARRAAAVRAPARGAAAAPSIARRSAPAPSTRRAPAAPQAPAAPVRRAPAPSPPSRPRSPAPSGGSRGSRSGSSGAPSDPAPAPAPAPDPVQ